MENSTRSICRAHAPGQLAAADISNHDPISVCISRAANADPPSSGVRYRHWSVSIG